MHSIFKMSHLQDFLRLSHGTKPSTAWCSTITSYFPFCFLAELHHVTSGTLRSQKHLFLNVCVKKALAERTPLPVFFNLFSLLILNSQSSLFLPVSPESQTMERLFPWVSCICSFDCRSDFFERVVGHFLDTQTVRSTSLQESKGQLIYHHTLFQSHFYTFGGGLNLFSNS